MIIKINLAHASHTHTQRFVLFNEEKLETYQISIYTIGVTIREGSKYSKGYTIGKNG